MQRCLWLWVLWLIAMSPACGGEPAAPERVARGVVCVAWPCCGDGSCDGGEHCASCPADCGCPVGETCHGEPMPGNSPVCVPACGDGTCDLSIGEDCASCMADCACTGMSHCQADPGNGTNGCVASCGDSVCEPEHSETCLSCGLDCPVCTDARIATGADAGGGPHVRTFNGSGGPAEASFLAYEASFAGGARVASIADGDGDGKPDIVVGPGPGRPSQVEVYSSTGTLRASFDAYPDFSGGVYVAAGDVLGDGASEIVTAPGVGGGPVIRVWRRDGTLLYGFYAFEDTFRGGARVGVADVDGDGKAEIIVGAGPGRAATVRVFRGDGQPFGSEITPFDPFLRGGVFVSGGDFDGASPRRDEILVGAGDLDRVAKPVLASQPGLKYFGYYWGDSTALGQHMDEYAPYTNFTGINSPDLESDARRARRFGLSVVVDVSNCFFELNTNGTEGWHLKDTWPSSWAGCIPTYKKVLEAADLFAFYIMDEPYGNHLTKAEVETAINAVHAAFPGERTMITENPVDWVVGPPAGIDIYSIDCYPGDPASNQQAWDWCKSRIIAGGNAAPPGAQLLVTAEAKAPIQTPPTLASQRAWYDFANDLAAHDPRYIGLYWFLYSDQVPAREGFQGTRAFRQQGLPAYHASLSLPQLCLNSWETLPVCGANGASYQNPDRAKCAGTTIAAYGACGPQVRVLRSDGTPVGPGVTPYWPPSWNGVHVAGVDLDRDGRVEIVTGPGAGPPSIVRRFLPDGAPLGLDFAPYPGFSGGVFVGGAPLPR